MLIVAFQCTFKYLQRKVFVREIFSRLFAVEVEREYFKQSHSYFTSDDFTDHIVSLKKLLDPIELDNYEYVYRYRMIRKFYKHVKSTLPKYVQEKMLTRQDSWMYYDLRELVKLHSQNCKSLAELKEILCKL